MYPPMALAADLPGAPESLPVGVHGFVSQGAIKSTGNNYLVKSKRGSLDFTEMGINFTVSPADQLRVGFQLFARRLGTTGNFNAKTDWFYLDYRFRDWLGVRAGRVKLPFGLYNDSSDIDSARVPILLPASLYPITSRDFLLAQSGFELYGYVDLRGAGALDYRLYGGAIQIDLPAQAGSTMPITSIETPLVAGGRLLWEAPVEGLRFGASLQVLRLEFSMASTSIVPAMGEMSARLATTLINYRIPAVLGVVSLEYSAHDLLFAAEYGLWRTRFESSPMVRPDTEMTNERLYVLAAYRVLRWLQPGAYYSLHFPDRDHRDGPGANQHDIAGTIRVDINANWLVKFETHYMHGTAGVPLALNDNKAFADMENDWFVFLLKTTGYF